MARTVFPHKDLAKLSYDFVPVIAHGNPDHGEGDFVVKGKKTHLCKIYDVASCELHTNMAPELSKRGLLKGVKGTPTHIMFNPHDLSEISRAHGMSVGQIEDAVKDAQKQMGKPVRYKDFQKMRKILDEAKAQVEKGDYKKALRAAKGFDAKGMKSLEAEAKAIETAVMEAGKKLLEEAKAALESGDEKQASKILKELTREFSGTDIGKEAKTLLESTKEK